MFRNRVIDRILLREQTGEYFREDFYSLFNDPFDNGECECVRAAFEARDESAAKAALCRYIKQYDFLPSDYVNSLCRYVNSVNWTGESSFCLSAEDEAELSHMEARLSASLSKLLSW